LIRVLSFFLGVDILFVCAFFGAFFGSIGGGGITIGGGVGLPSLAFLLFSQAVLFLYQLQEFHLHIYRRSPIATEFPSMRLETIQYKNQIHE